jgi:uncharacterized repeat protein (TIGR01451 family)
MPIQVQMMTGACAREVVSAHGYTLQPRDVWNTDYWAPVPGFRETGDDERPNVDTDIYLHNPDLTEAIRITVTSGLSVTNLVIPPNSTISVLNETDDVEWPDLAASNQGTHLVSEDVFWGLSVIDSATNGAGDSQDWDWGYSLIPETELSSQIVVGYAPGRPEDRPYLENGNIAFVVAVTDTVLFVDLDQDGQPDAFDMNGDGDADDVGVWGVPDWDERSSGQGVPIRASQVLRVGDPVDYNLEGARIYTTELAEHIAAAWGQDPTRADQLMYLDLGYTLLPLVVPRLSKSADLADDADGSGSVSPGDTLTYTLVVHNNGMGSLNRVVLTDSLPYTYTDLLVDSLQITAPPPVETVEYYHGGGWRTTPVSDAQMLRLAWFHLKPGQAVTVTFRVLVHSELPATIVEFCNQSVVSSATTDPISAKVCTPLQHLADLAIHKSDAPDPVGPRSPDRRLTYTLVYTNHARGLAENAVVSDTLPLDVVFDSASPPQVEGPNPLVWYLGDLASGASGTITVSVVVAEETWVGKVITNVATIASDTPEFRYDNNTAREPTRTATDMTIVKFDDPDPGLAGQPLTYTLVYTNDGPFEARGVVISDVLPEKVTYGRVLYQPEGWSDPPTYTAGPPETLVWYTPTLASGATGRLVYVVTADATVTGTIVNRACISWRVSDVERAFKCAEQPTSAQLLYFRARPVPGAILLEWETAWELDTLGFYLLRSATGRLTDAAEIAYLPAAGRGRGGGAFYRHRDLDIGYDRSYTYWLVEVETGGRRTVHNPTSVAAAPGFGLRIYLPIVYCPL